MNKYNTFWWIERFNIFWGMFIIVGGEQGSTTWSVIGLKFSTWIVIYIFFFCVKRDWGYLRETWSVIYIQRDPWLRHLFPRENDTKAPKIRVFKRYISNARYIHQFNVETIPTTFHWGISRIVADDYMRRVHVHYGYHGNVLQQWRGGGGGGGRDLFLWIINGTIFFLITNNLSLLLLRKINWR